MDELQELELLLNELLQGIQGVIQSGEILSDEFQGVLAQELSYLTDRIDVLKQEAANQGVPPLDKAPFQSAVVNAFKYDPKNGNLFVKFQGDYPQDNGSVYKYSNVPKFIVDIFSQGSIVPKTSGSNDWHTWKKGVGPSLGASLNSLLKKGGFMYTKLT